MRHAVLRILLLAMCGIASAAASPPGHEHAIRTAYEEDGREIGWYVSDAQFLETPQWKFDGRSDPPLSMPVGRILARSCLGAQSVPKDEFVPTSKLRAFDGW
jgi:hypothetical protein